MEIVRFALLGLGTGAVYALLAQGLVVVYRGSGLINFSQGAIAMVGAFAYFEFTVRDGLSKWVSLCLALALCAVLGTLIQLVILRPMQRSSALSRVIATLGVTICLQAAVFLRYGHDPHSLPSLLPIRTVHVFSDQLPIGENMLIIIAIGAVCTTVLTLVYRYTSFGRTTTAVAENPIVAASLAHSPTRIASLNWALASALAGLAGILIAPIIFLEPTTLVLLVVPALAAALFGQFASFPVTFALSLALGIAASEIGRYVSEPGWATAAPFIVVIAILTWRGQVLPLRSFVLDRLPAIGNGRIRPVPVLVIFVVAAVVTLKANGDWSVALTSNLAVAIMCLSIVVITGYAGQLSLAQGVLAGLAALVAARLSNHMPFLLLLVIGAGVAAAAGGVIGIPALRTRGVTLAVATLGLSAALSAVILQNQHYNGGSQGIFIRTPSIFGWNLDPLFHGNRYAFIVLVFFTVLALAVANLRRGTIGRRLLALRSNERAAAALGIPGAQLKTYAFMLASAIAGLGGVFLAFSQSSVNVSSVDNFSVFAGITLIAVVVVGGIGFIGGALIGSTLVAGGVASQALNGWHQINDYLPLIGGLTVLFVLIFQPDGIFEANRQAMVAAFKPVSRRISAPLARLPHGNKPAFRTTGGTHAQPKTLRVSGLSVSFGGVHAVQNVDLEVRPGEIHGLIGPNGAGKTTVIDAITGFVRSQSGSVRIGDTDITHWSAHRRPGAGVSRSFQSLELFDDLTILDNLAVASEHPHAGRYLTDLVRPGRATLSQAAVEAIREFELTDILDRKPSEISFGVRKTVAIARAIAASPSVLLLDEPAAGLDDHEAAELAALIQNIAHNWGIGVLLVEHKVDMITAISDRITVLEYGQVIATGAPSNVVEDPAVINAYLGTAVTV
jgi:ABC-type branched-subunit amino acid transport system ATPase component/branched-subunit amino acid ABC-type transport system permease component